MRTLYNNQGVRTHFLHHPLPQSTIDWFRIHYQHSSFNGRFQIGCRKKGASAVCGLRMYEVTDMDEFLQSMHVSPHIDYYITANSVSGVKRQKDALFSLHNIVLDIDCHQSSPLFGYKSSPPDFGYQAGNPEVGYIDPAPLEDFIFHLKHDLFPDNALPSPTSVVWTGRGLQLWWAIVPISYKCLTWYQEIREALISRIRVFMDEYRNFDGLSIDSSSSGNVVGYFRLPGTYNTKSGSRVEVQNWVHTQYDTHELIKWAKAWESEYQKDYAGTQSSSFIQGPEPLNYSDADIYLLKNIHTTAFFRAKQLVCLRNLRDDKIGEETRNNMNFIFYNALLPALGHDKAWDKLMLFNAGFKEPMSEKELHQTIDTAQKKGGYRYKNSSMIQFLGITPQEQEIIGLYSPTQPYSRMTRVSNHPGRKASVKLAKDTRNAKIMELSAAGLSATEISSKMGIARNTVISIIGVRNKSQESKALFAAGYDIVQVAQTLEVSKRTAERYYKQFQVKEESALTDSTQPTQTPLMLFPAIDTTVSETRMALNAISSIPNDKVHDAALTKMQRSANKIVIDHYADCPVSPSLQKEPGLRSPIVSESTPTLPISQWLYDKYFRKIRGPDDSGKN